MAKAAIDEFFTLDKWLKQAARYGWRILRHGEDDLVVIAVVPALLRNGESDEFTLRLTCDYYPTYPPDVRFVNPETLEYDPGLDLHHLPQLQAPYCAIHPTYGYPTGVFAYGPQLVCSSMTLGYYFSGHNPTPDQLWIPGRDTIGSSIYTVYKALNSEYYKGRRPRQQP